MSTDRRGHALIVVHEASLTGAPRSALETLRVMRNRGWRRTVVLQTGGPLEPEFRRLSNRLIMRPGGLPNWLRRRLRWRGYSWWADRDRRVAHEVLRAVRPDIVWTETITTLEYAQTATEIGVPAACMIRERVELVRAFVDAFGRSRCRGIRLLANSRATADTVSAIVGRPLENIPIVYPPIDIDSVLVRARTGEVVEAPGALVLGVGRVSRVKGVDLWLDVARRVTAELPGTRFRWVGGTTGLRRWRYGIGLRTAGDISFLGWRNEPESLIAAADIVTVSSRHEPLSRVAVEALALGTPVVAFAVGGLPEALGNCGVLVPSRDTSAMSTEVIRLLRDDVARRRLGVCGPDQAQQFNLPMFVSRIEEQLDALEQEHDGGR